MRLDRLGPLTFILFSFAFLCWVSTTTLRTAVAANSSGQPTQSQSSRARPVPPAAPPPPLADQQQFVPYWTTEAGWDTEIELRNNQASGSLTVTPALRSADGTEVPLQPVLVQPREVKIIDVAAATSGTAMLGKYGSAVLRYRASDGNILFAMAMVLAVGHPFAFHIDPYSQFSGYKAGSREGIWWLPKNTTTGYLIVTNASDKPVETILSLYDATGRAMRQKVTLAAASSPSTRAGAQESTQTTKAKTGVEATRIVTPPTVRGDFPI